MRNSFRSLAFFLAIICILLTFFGCNSADNGSTTTEPISAPPAASDTNLNLKIPYCRNDTFDPFKAGSMLNQQISSLLYDSLFTVDESYSPITQIAEKSQLDTLNLDVSLKSNVLFSDNSKLTSKDVVYSFELAKKSPNFSARMSIFKSAKADGDYKVVFLLNSPEPNASANLIFPIVKSGSVLEKVDSASVEQTPVGSGRYTLAKDEEDFVLKSNSSRLSGYSPKMDNVHLVNVTDVSAMPYSLEIGSYNFMFDDLGSGNYRRTNASTIEVTLNNMVYMTFNKANTVLADASVRKAINMIISREEIVLTSFQGHAVKADTPFNPKWNVIKGLDFVPESGLENAIKALENSGYKRISDSGIRYNGSKNLYFELLVNKDNEFKCATADYIAAKLKGANISVNVKKLKDEEYKKAINKGSYDLYLGEVKLTPCMNLNSMLSKGGAVSFGINTAGAASTAYAQFLSGEKNVKEFVEAFNEDLPFIPLCYRNGIAACSRSIKVPLESSFIDVYSSISNWTF